MFPSEHYPFVLTGEISTMSTLMIAGHFQEEPSRGDPHKSRAKPRFPNRGDRDAIPKIGRLALILGQTNNHEVFNGGFQLEELVSLRTL